MEIKETLGSIKKLRDEERTLELEILNKFNIPDNLKNCSWDIQDHTDKKFEIGEFDDEEFSEYCNFKISSADKTKTEYYSVYAENIYQYKNYILLNYFIENEESRYGFAGIFLEENNEGESIQSFIDKELHNTSDSNHYSEPF